MSRQHIQAHAQVVEALGGRAPRQPQQVVYREGNTSQINPRRNPRSNFRDRSGRRKTTGFEEIRQEYYQLHHNKAKEDEPAAQQATATVHRGQSVDDSQEFFPKPSAFIRTPRRQVAPRRPLPTDMEDDELVGGPVNFKTRGSKAADMFQRRRERSDQFILDQENASPTPAAQQAPIQIELMQSGPPKKQPSRGQQQRHQPQPPQQQRQPQHHQQQPQHHQPQPQHYQQQPQHHRPQQQQHRQPTQQKPQQQFQQPRQQQTHQPRQQQTQQRPKQPQQQRRQPQQQQYPQPQGHTTVDSKRTRQPLAPKSPRFEPNSPWNDRNMQVGKRFHSNVIPYQDNYNTSPKGWGGPGLYDDNNIKDHYNFTETSQKYQFTPAPRLNKFGSGLKSPQNESYNSRPRSWCDIDLTASPQAPPSRRAYPSVGRQHSESSANQYAGQSGWGHGESEEL